MYKTIDIKHNPKGSPLTHLLFEGGSKLSQALEKTRKNLQFEQNLIRKDVDLNTKKRTATSKRNDKAEVNRLQDDVGSSVCRSHFVVRYTENRKRKQIEIQNELFTALEIFGNETKEGLRYVFQHLSNSIDENHTEIEEMILSFKTAEAYQSETDIKNVWACIDVKYEENRIWLEEFCFTLVKQETFKLYKVQKLLRKIYNKLAAVINLNQTGRLRDYIFHLAMEIQKLSLNNQKYFVDLKWSLTAYDLNLKNGHFLTWNLYWLKWLQEVTNASLHQLKASMKALSEGEYGYIKDLIVKFKNDCDHFAKERLQLIYTVRNIKPPNCSKSAINIWVQSFSKLNSEHDCICAALSTKITLQNPNLRKQLIEELEKIKMSLRTRNICTEETLNQILGIDKIELMDEYLFDLSMTIEKVKKEKIYQKNAVDGLEKFTIEVTENVVDLWEIHQSALTDLNKNVEVRHEKLLEEMGAKCDYEEKRLGFVLDNLRQEGEKENLNKKFNCAKKHLGELENYYRLYNEKRIEVAKNLPNLILIEVNRYRVDLKNFFGFSVGYLLDPIATFGKNVIDLLSEEQDERPPSMNKSEEEKKETETEEKEESEKQLPEWKNIDLTGLVLSSYPSGTLSHVELAVARLLSLPMHAFSSDKLAQWPGSEKWAGYEPRIQHIMRILGVNFAAHWEDWLFQRIRNANAVRENKIIELNNELEFRLKHLKSRKSKIFKDIFKVREEELSNHFTLVSRHVTKISNFLLKEEHKLKDLIETQNKSFEDINLKYGDAERKMENSCFNGALLLKKKDLETLFKTHIYNELEFLDHRQNDFDSFCDDMINSNANFVNSFKSFYDDGNFSEEEIVKYGSTISSLKVKIETFRKSMNDTIKNLQNKWKTVEAQLIQNFEEKWEHLEMDLEFFESINRSFRSTISTIKTEVRKSNTTNKKLQTHLDNMASIIEEKNSLDTSELVFNCINLHNTLIDDCVEKGVQFGVVVSRPDDVPEEEEEKKPVTPKKKLPLVVQLIKPKDKKTVELLINEVPKSGKTFDDAVKIALWKTQNEVLDITEEYFQKKGTRPSSFPELLPDSTEGACKDLITKMKSFWNQAKDFGNENVREFCCQMEKLEAITNNFILFIFERIQIVYKTEIEKKATDFEVCANELLKKWNSITPSFKNQLHPHLGYLSYSNKLEKLLEDAGIQRKSFKNQLEMAYDEAVDVIKQSGQHFTEGLHELSENLLKSLDKMPISKDFAESSNPPLDADSPAWSPPATITLPTNQDENEVWPGIQHYEWSTQETAKTPEIKTTKRLPTQESVIRHRDTAHTDFGTLGKFFLDQLKNNLRKKINEIDKWHENFVNSVSDLKDAVVNFR